MSPRLVPARYLASRLPHQATCCCSRVRLDSHFNACMFVSTSLSEMGTVGLLGTSLLLSTDQQKEMRREASIESQLSDDASLQVGVRKSGRERNSPSRALFIRAHSWSPTFSRQWTPRPLHKLQSYFRTMSEAVSEAVSELKSVEALTCRVAGG